MEEGEPSCTFDRGKQPAEMNEELEASLQAMSLLPREEVVVHLEQTEYSSQVRGQFNMLMKVGDSGGQYRPVPLEGLKSALARVWTRVYLDISQVDTNLFLAHFRSSQDQSWVWARQPWLFGSDNFILEWVPTDQRLKPFSAYHFSHIMVTVHLYGISKKWRSVDNVKLIAQKIGQVSAANPIDEETIKKSLAFISVRMRIHVWKPVKDATTIVTPDNNRFTVYLYFERIGRICSLCGFLFHNSPDYPVKQKISLQMKVDDDQQLQDKFGKWIT